MRQLVRAAAIFAATVLLGATLTGSVAGEGDTALRKAIGAGVSDLNNAFGDVTTSAVTEWLYNGLYAFDETLTPVPDIAAGYPEVSEDGRVWTFELRDDVYFQPSGERLTADDIVFTYQLANSAQCSFNPYNCLAHVTVTPEGADTPVKVLRSVEALDDHTVRFTLAEPYAPFSMFLAALYIDSRDAVEAAFADFEERTSEVTPATIDALIATLSESDDPGSHIRQAETILTQAGADLPDPTPYAGEDGALDEVAYAEALQAALAELRSVLAADAIDRIAAAYRYLDTAHHPVGTGPFYVSEVRDGQDITALRNERYHHGPPQLERVHFLLTDAAVADAALLETGAVDWAGVSPDTQARLSDVEGLKFAQYPGFGYFALQFNLRDGRLFADKALRQALAYCIDKEATVAAATDGHGIPAYADLPPTSWAYNSEVPRYEQDIEKANALLDDAGWSDTDGDGIREKDGRRLASHILMRAGAPERAKFMHLLADQARECGFDLTLSEASYEALIRGLSWPLVMPGQDEQWDAYFGGWGTSYDPYLHPLWHSSNCVTEDRPDRYNWICFQDERADALIEAGQRELDRERRAEIYHEFEMIMAEELPYLWAWSEQVTEGLAADVHGAEAWTEAAMSSPTWYWQMHHINKGGTVAPM